MIVIKQDIFNLNYDTVGLCSKVKLMCCTKRKQLQVEMLYFKLVIRGSFELHDLKNLYKYLPT